MNVLVTGGAGYIGSHTCKELSQKGHRPVTVDNLVHGHEASVRWGPFYKLDIRETEKLASLMMDEKIESVIHFAAYAYVGESMQNPLKYFENNVGGSLSLFQAMAHANVKKIIFSSTCATYGIPTKLPISERSEQKPINPYGQSKLMVEHFLRSLCENKGWSATALRYFNAAGADPDGELGEDHHPETHLIPLVIRAAFDEKSPITVYGEDYPMPDGTCIRDYIHVSDLAVAHVLALDSTNAGQFRALNLGTGRGYSVKEVIAGVEEILDRKVNVVRGSRRDGDPAELVAQTESAFVELGWKPRHSDLKTILRTAMDWRKRVSTL